MLVKLFVGNLPWSVGDAELEEIFRALGEVVSARRDHRPRHGPIARVRFR